MSNSRPSSADGSSQKEIIRQLSRLEYTGVRPDPLFEDCVALSVAALRALPRHIESARKGEPLTDDEETAALMASTQKRYGTAWDEVYTTFARCLGVLLERMAEAPYEDVVGDVYMLYAYPNPGTGQYFTPTPVCRMMAKMIVGAGEAHVFDKIHAALDSTPDHPLYPFARGAARVCQSMPDNPPLKELMRWTMPLAIENGFEPVKVLDPCCGSGAMFLAAAEQFAPWMVQAGLVQFYGQDIDPTCVAMATLNLMLIGANGYSVRCLSALSDLDLSALPLPPRYKEVAVEAREAMARGDVNHVRDLSRMAHESVREGMGMPKGRRGQKQKESLQLGLFEL